MLYVSKNPNDKNQISPLEFLGQINSKNQESKPKQIKVDIFEI